MVASHNNGVLSYHHSLNPQSPPSPPQPLLSLAIIYLGSNPMALISIGPRYKGYLCGDDPPTMFFLKNPSGQFCSKRERERERDLGFICEVCLASRKTLDYL